MCACRAGLDSHELSVCMEGEVGFDRMCACRDKVDSLEQCGVKWSIASLSSTLKNTTILTGGAITQRDSYS